MINCIIIADSITVDAISGFFEGLPLTIVGMATSYEEGLSLIIQSKRCLVYIDADLIKSHDVELQLLKGQCCFCILSNSATAFDAFVDLGMCCLFKPITIHKFEYSLEQFGRFLVAPLKNRSFAEPMQYFFVKAKKKGLSPVKIKFSELLYIEVEQNYLKYFHENGNTYIEKLSLKTMEEKLPKDFFAKINKSQIVNNNIVTDVVGNWVIINSNKNMILPIGSKYKKSFFANPYIQKIINSKKISLAEVNPDCLLR